MGQKARLVGDVDRVAAQLTPPGVGGPDDYTMGPHCLPQPFLGLHALHKIFVAMISLRKKTLFIMIKSKRSKYQSDTLNILYVANGSQSVIKTYFLDDNN